jgi:NADPH-dependent 2,4-dienoyl-CoA reductase/sulfur reductase-like enzyme
MRIIIIGAVAAGTSAAAQASRNDRTSEIVIYEKDEDISYSGCGLPYYISGRAEDINIIVPRDSAFFKMKYNVDVLTRHEVLSINPGTKELTIKKISTGEVFNDRYDKLVVSTGAVPFVPNIKGIYGDNVFFLRNVENARNIKSFIDTRKPQNAIIAGTGFIGLEMLECLMEKGINVTIIEKHGKIAPNLDEDMAAFLEDALADKNINILKNTSIISIDKHKVILEDGKEIKTEMVIMATGVRPNVTLAKEAGIELGETGAIKVNRKLETNIKDIYACGDCIETFSVITGKPVYRPLGTTANKTGKIAGDLITERTAEYKGNLGTNICKLFDMTIATTGLTEKEAIAHGYHIAICHDAKEDKATYFNGREMHIKAVADKKTKKLLGVQIIGHQGVDKRIDIFATLITFGAKIHDIFHIDLAYAPPFSTVKDAVHYTGMKLDDVLSKNN